FRDPLWNGGRIVFSIEDGGNTHVYSVATDGSSAPELILGGERAITGYDMHGDTIAYVASTHTTLGELFIGDRQVTNLTGHRAFRGPIEGGPGWGTVDYEDVLGVVDTALQKYDFLDPDRLGMIGGSYGGFMTSWTIGHDHRFKAAVSERAVNHMVSAAGSSDLFWVFEQQFGGQWFDHVDAWLERSPATYAKNIETPVLVLHSENDLRCTVEQ